MRQSVPTRLAGLILSAALAACQSSAVNPDGGDAGTCQLPDGGTLRTGQAYAQDCNTCQCQANGQFACTQVGCPPDGGTTCSTPDGRRVSAGEPYTYQCNTCTCQADGTAICTARACVEDGGFTDGGGGGTDCFAPDGTPVASGQRYNDGCNSCTCQNGQFACTARDCSDGGQRTCRTSADCSNGEECHGPDGCDVPWTCQPAAGRPCTRDWVQYCTCDGRTVFGSSSCPPEPFRSRSACDTDAGFTDVVTTGCTAGSCSIGQLCCERSGQCYDSRCLSCCM